MAGDFEVRINDAGLRLYQRRLERKMEDVLGKAAMDTAAAAQRNHDDYLPLLWDIGAMHAAWDSKRVGRLEWIAGNWTEYAIYHELGTVTIPARPCLLPAFTEQLAILRRALA